MTIIGVGTDILDERRIVRLVDSGGDRFLSHWYTPAEADGHRAAPRPGRSAARGFAVKEATLKAMGASFPGPVRWWAARPDPAPVRRGEDRRTQSPSRGGLTSRPRPRHEEG